MSLFQTSGSQDLNLQWNQFKGQLVTQVSEPSLRMCVSNRFPSATKEPLFRSGMEEKG